jgi:hypothetical protein
MIDMPAKASGDIKTRIVHNTQKNGDIYPKFRPRF